MADRDSASRRMAILVDGDNAQASLIDKVVVEASKYGIVTIRRIYGDWTEPQMKSWKAIMQDHAFTPIQQFRNTIGKNATDSAMIIDAMDILYTGSIDGFCLVASDSDYTRLATRIREKGMFVMGIGKRMTPRAFVNACEVFVYTENLVDPPKVRARPVDPTPSVPSEMVPATPAQPFRELFSAAFDLAVGDNGWAFLSDVGNRLRQLDPGFDSRTYGFTQLTKLVAANADWIEMKRAKKRGSSSVIAVRIKSSGPAEVKP
jgi:hypothetical protein